MKYPRVHRRKFSKQVVELRILEAFRKALESTNDRFPEGEVRQGDKPDFIVLGPRKIGVEITGLYLEDGRNPASESQQSLRRDGIMSEAQKLYLSNGGKGIELHFELDYIDQRRRKVLPEEIAEFAKRIESKARMSIIPEMENAPKEIKSLYHSGEYPNPVWRANQGRRVRPMDPNRLRQIIAEKERKASSYEQCEVYWLLIFMNPADRAQEQETRTDDPHITSTVFENIYIFNTDRNHIVKIK